MRTCQICLNTGKRVVLADYDSSLCLFECTSCGHRYVDGLVDQAWFDNYYMTEYTTDDKSYSDARLKALANCVESFRLSPQKPYHVLDIGGMDGELQKRIDAKVITCDVVGVGGETKKKYDAVVLSHTLEHIYDIGAMFERIENAMKKKSHLIIEIPIHLYDNYQAPQAYDYHWQHINKFRPRDIEALFIRNGYAIEVSEQISDYREYQCWRIVGGK